MVHILEVFLFLLVLQLQAVLLPAEVTQLRVRQYRHLVEILLIAPLLKLNPLKLVRQQQVSLRLKAIWVFTKYAQTTSGLSFYISGCDIVNTAPFSRKDPIIYIFDDEEDLFLFTF